MPKGYTLKLCSIGLGGNSMEYDRGCHGSWYLFSVEDIAKHYAAELTEGIICIDKRPAVEADYHYAYASPMVCVDMEPGQVDRFMARYAVDNLMVSALKETGYRPIIQAAEIAAEESPDLPGPLDYVPIDYYVEWWRTRGAVIYRYDGEKFVAA